MHRLRGHISCSEASRCLGTESLWESSSSRQRVALLSGPTCSCCIVLRTARYPPPTLVVSTNRYNLQVPSQSATTAPSTAPFAQLGSRLVSHLFLCQLSAQPPLRSSRS